MAEPFTIGGIIAAAVLFSPAAQEHDRLKTIAYTANKYHKTPEAARSAFFRMANANDTQAQAVDRVDSLPPAHVRPASPTQAPNKFAQNPIPLIPDEHQQAADSIPSDESSQNRTPRQKSLVPRYLPDHCRQAIDKKWAAKKASKDAQHQKQCDKLDHRYGGTEAKRNKRQQKLNDKHRKKIKSLELKRCIEISMGEWRARREAEKQQKKRLRNGGVSQPGIHVHTDGAAERSDQRSRARSRLSSHHRLTRESSSDGIFSFTATGWQPTTLNAA